MARLLRYVAMKSTLKHMKSTDIHTFYFQLPITLKPLPNLSVPSSHLVTSALQAHFFLFGVLLPASRFNTVTADDLSKNCNISMFHNARHLQVFHSTIYICFLHKKNTHFAKEDSATFNLEILWYSNLAFLYLFKFHSSQQIAPTCSLVRGSVTSAWHFQTFPHARIQSLPCNNL